MITLAQLSAHHQADRLTVYSPMRQAVPFHASAHPRRLARAPNQTSKTISGAVEAWAHATGAHPCNPAFSRAPADGLILIADLQNMYSAVCAKLREVEPGHQLHADCRYIKGKGYYTNGKRLIRLHSGITIEFRGGRGEVVSVASITVGWLWIDEPPGAQHFGEALARVAVFNGPAWMTFTPIGRPVEWLRHHVEGDRETGAPPKEEWEQHSYQLAVEPCTTVDGLPIRDEASIAAQVAACPVGQEGQRLRGEWEGVTQGRALPGFDPSAHVRPLSELVQLLNGHTPEWRLGFDHGEGHQKKIALVTARIGRTFLVLGEYRGPGNTTEHDDAAAVLEVLAQLREAGADVSAELIGLRGRAIGDSNSAGLGGSGRAAAGAKFNDFLERAFALALHLELPPFRIEVPYKGPGSVQTGEALLNTAFKQGQLLIAQDCTALIKSLSHYTLKRESNLKDAIDCLRYSTADVLRDVPPIPLNVSTHRDAMDRQAQRRKTLATLRKRARR
jgi:hypothetical protein